DGGDPMRPRSILAAAIVLSGVPAFAQDSTTTTTTTTRQTPGASVTIEHNAPATVESREVTTGSVSDCKSKTVTSQNDMGDKTTVHKEKCN
ncbi:hypothetical protein WDZ92_53210, partial [Nostoc sp. NIES-2111]